MDEKKNDDDWASMVTVSADPPSIARIGRGCIICNEFIEQSHWDMKLLCPNCLAALRKVTKLVKDGIL